MRFWNRRLELDGMSGRKYVRLKNILLERPNTIVASILLS